MSAMSPSTIAEALPRWRLLLYASPSMLLAALGLPVMVLLPAAYAEDFGLGLARAATALLIARLFDVAIDPLVGWLSDRLPGGRRQWLMLGLPLVIAAGWQLFRPTLPVSTLALAAWSILFSLGVTLVTVPYQAWGVELSRDDRQRLVIASWREGLGLIGVLTAMVAYSLSSGDTGQRLAGFFPPVALMLCVALLAAVAIVPEPRRQRPSPGAAIASLAPLLHNRPFCRLLLAQSINALANGLPATLFLPFVSYRLHRPDAVGPLLLLYFGASICGIPLWWKVARHLPKRRAWRISLTLTALAFAPTLMLGGNDLPAFAAICLLTVLGLAGDLALPAAILAETVHDQQRALGRSPAGLFVSLWALCGKLALALAVGIAFPLLQAGGMTAEGGGEQILTLLYAGLPILLKLLAVWILAAAPQPSASPLRITP